MMLRSLHVRRKWKWTAVAGFRRLYAQWHTAVTVSRMGCRGSKEKNQLQVTRGRAADYGQRQAVLRTRSRSYSSALSSDNTHVTATASSGPASSANGAPQSSEPSLTVEKTADGDVVAPKEEAIGDDNEVVDASGSQKSTDDGTPKGSGVTVSTVAGCGRTGSADGPAAEATFRDACRLVPDSAGNIYVTDPNNHLVRAISPDGVVSTIAGRPCEPGSIDGHGKDALLVYPVGITIDECGALFVTEPGEHINRVRRLSRLPDNRGWAVETVTPADAGLSGPQGIVADGEGSLVIANERNPVVCEVDAESGESIEVLAGCGKAGYVDGPGDTAAFQRPHGLTLTPDGDIIIADQGGKIRRVAIEDNTVTTVAGGQHGYRDGPATDARFNRPEDVAVDGAGVIWVADTFNHVIRRIDPDGMVSTVAGVPEKNGFRDGDATQALFSWPSGIAIEGDGCLLVADKVNQRIRRVEGLGVVPRDDMPRDVDDCEYPDLAHATDDETHLCPVCRENPEESGINKDICVSCGQCICGPCVGTGRFYEDCRNKCPTCGGEICLHYGIDRSTGKLLELLNKRGRHIPAVLNKLGERYLKGVGTKRNVRDGYQYFYKAAALEHPGAQINMSNCYMYGIGVSKNPAMAITWARRAAEKGDANGQALLASLYVIEDDFEEAFKWFTLAAEQGHDEAQSLLKKYWHVGE